MATERGRLLEELTWPAVAALIDEGHDLALLPVGATEQHGRHLPLSTDSEIAAAVCREASLRTGVPVLPTVQIGSSGAHTEKWPGTLSLPPRLLVDVVVELARWIRAAGFRKLLVVNAHVGNAAAFQSQLRGVGFGRFEVIQLDELDLTTADFKRAPGRVGAGR